MRVQATIWKDRKIVGYLHSHHVVPDPEKVNTVKRFSPRLKKKREIPSPLVGIDYSKHMNGVDRADRDTADYTVSLRSARYYLRIFYWLLDGVVHSMFIVTGMLLRDQNDDHPWQKYRKHHDARYKFQYDLGKSLIEKGLTMDWVGDPTNPTSKRPAYARKQQWIPGKCKSCFFCKHKLTNGVDHRGVTKKGTLKRKRSVPLCSKVRERLKNSKMCYLCRKKEKSEVEANGFEWCEKTHRRGIKQTKLGCIACNVGVCEDWNEFDHKVKR